MQFWTALLFGVKGGKGLGMKKEGKNPPKYELNKKIRQSV